MNTFRDIHYRACSYITSGFKWLELGYLEGDEGNEGAEVVFRGGERWESEKGNGERGEKREKEKGRRAWGGMANWHG